MTDDRDKEPAGNDAPKKRWWTSLPGRRSGGPDAGGGITEDEWTWLGDDATAIEPKRRRSRLGPKIAGILACSGLVAIVIAFAATSTGNSGDAQVSALASPSRSATPTSNATVEPTATAEPTPAGPTPTRLPATAAPTPKPPFTLAVWDATQAKWQTGDLTLRSAGSPQAGAIPYLIHIDDVTIDHVYSVNIRYDCDAGQGGGFAFLTDYNRNLTTDPALAAGGPISAVPYAAVPIQDDPAITTDEEQGVRLMSLWGAEFALWPTGPEPTTGCDGTRLVNVRLIARSETVYVMWAGQVLAPNPAGRFGMEVTIDGLPGTARLDAVPEQ